MPESFTADDVTIGGHITADPLHQPNGKQNSIGSLFNKAARRGLIEFTGNISKGGGNRIWRATEAGELWARSVLAT
jgi:hypothetical protein